MDEFDTGAYYKKQLKRSADEMKQGEESMARYTSRKLMQGEAAVQTIALHFCREAGDDRRGSDAQLQAQSEQALDLIRAGHRILSVIGAKRDVLDIPGEGGR